MATLLFANALSSEADLRQMPQRFPAKAQRHRG